MVLGKPKPAHTSIIVPRLLPKPRCFRPTAAAAPWIAVDPVLRADCVLLCRSVQLAFVAFLALLAGTRNSFAVSPTATPDRLASVRLPQTGSEMEQSVSICSERTLPSAQKEGERSFIIRDLSVARSYLDPLIPKVPQLNLERAHAPPAAASAFLKIRTHFRSTARLAVSLPFASSHPGSPLPFRSTSDIPTSRFAESSHFAWSGRITARASVRVAASLHPHLTSDPGGITHVCC